jgi:Putative transposase
MTHHPHVHMIVPGGGISLDGGRWVRWLPGFLLRVRVLSRLSRRLFLAGLADAHTVGRLAFFDELNDLRNRIAFAISRRCGKKNWLVHAKPPFTGPDAVLAYAHGHARAAYCVHLGLSMSQMTLSHGGSTGSNPVVYPPSW